MLRLCPSLLIPVVLATALSRCFGAPAAAPADARLDRKVTLAVKATALSDVCERLRKDTGIALAAGASVADEKVTVFCKQVPVRDVMRQLSQPFGYTWLRSGKEGETRYELAQDLRSQLAEEERRARDRNAALVALDRDMGVYREFRELSPDAAQARVARAAGEEKHQLERLAGFGWGPVQLYFRLTPAELAALRSGKDLTFSPEPKPGELPLPPEIARGVLQSLRDFRIVRRGGDFRSGLAESVPDGLPPSAFPEARAEVRLSLREGELGTVALDVGSGFFIEGRGNIENGVLAGGQSPTASRPANAAANAPLARDPTLQRSVTLQPKASCRLSQPPGYPDPPVYDEDGYRVRPSPGPRVTSADVLEAIHQATGIPIVADFYTRLHKPEAVSVPRTSLFDALNKASDALRLRWRKEGEWLQFRSVSFAHDRLKEVPNRLLERWAASRREHGALTFDDLIEIAGLSDVQLNSSAMAQGARACYDLAEWDLARQGGGDWAPGRRQLRYLAGFSPERRRQAMSATGLPFTQMPLAQQQQFLAAALAPEDTPPTSPELAQARLHVLYTVPGWFEWVVLRPQDPTGPSASLYARRPAPVRERTRDAALLAARRIVPGATPAQIAPSTLGLSVAYLLGDPSTGRGRQYVWNGGQSGLRTLPVK